MTDYKYFTSFGIRFDLNLAQSHGEKILFTSFQDKHAENVLGRYDLKPIQRYDERTYFDSSSYSGFLKQNHSFQCRGMQFYILREFLDALNPTGGTQYKFCYDYLIWQKNGVRQKFDAIDFWVSPRSSQFRWRFDEIIAVRNNFRIRFDSFNTADRLTKFSSFYDLLLNQKYRGLLRWHAIPCEFRAKEFFRFNSVKKELAALSFWKQVFVRPGWRIIARNILTDELFDVGFINTDSPDHSLTDIFLPNGDYEISVLTSSLFWKDAADKNIRMISIRDGDEVSPLPVIYNLRSFISQGTTVIEWSANQSEAEDCLFCLWYSFESPVDTSRQPDTTIWYDSSQTEYRTTFNQTAPAYVAVAAMRPGNEPELGNIHELFLEWSFIPPRAPDDVMVLDTPFSAIDSTIETLHSNEPDLVLWQ